MSMPASSNKPTQKSNRDEAKQEKKTNSIEEVGKEKKGKEGKN